MMKNQECKTLSHNVLAPVLRAAVVAVLFAKQSVAVDHPMKPGCVLVSKCYVEPQKLKPTQNARNVLPATTNAFGQPSHTLICDLFSSMPMPSSCSTESPSILKAHPALQENPEATQNNQNCIIKSFPTKKSIPTFS